MIDLKKRSNCRLCKSTSVQLAIPLAPTPPANAFVRKEDCNKVQKKYPLDVYFCENCYHVQLLDVVHPEILFKDYVYVSGTSPVFVRHFSEYADELIEQYHLGSDDFVLDIGSNDGTLLGFFQKKSIRVLGIDPAVQISKEANQKGIETINDFFSVPLSEKIKSSHGKASAIVANNVFAHIDDLDEIVLGVKNLLNEKKGVFVFEVSYLRDVIEKNLFDTIYHEHLCYHSVAPLLSFFKNHKMEVIDAKRVSSHGGSIRITVQNENGGHLRKDSVQKLIDEEKKLGLHKLETFVEFKKSIQKIGTQFKQKIMEARAQGKKAVGFGAPAKATTLLYEFGIDSGELEWIVDDSPYKQDLFTPGMHIPVFSSQALYEKKSDLCVILAWNFSESIIKNHSRYLEQGGSFMIPFPEIKVVSA